MGTRCARETRSGFSNGLADWLSHPVPEGARLTRSLLPVLVMLFAVEALTGLALAAYYAPSTTDAWAIGDNELIRWNGTAWASEPVPAAQTMYSVWARGPTEAWAVGAYDSIWQWDGTGWQELSGGTTTFGLFNTVWGGPAGEVRIGGTSSRILRR